MIISLENNKKYNGMLNDIRVALYPAYTGKTFRTEAKMLDPDFPRKDGEKISMRDITEDQLAAHTKFLKTMCIKEGLRLEYFTDSDILDAEAELPHCRIDGDFVEEDGQFVGRIVCSSCGSSTKRQLTKERLAQAKAISEGKVEEIIDHKEVGWSESFICLNCMTREVREMEVSN
jgi:hypothetical protein